MTNEQMAMLYMLYIARKNSNARDRLTAGESHKLMSIIYKNYDLFEKDIISLERQSFISIVGVSTPNYNGPQYAATDIVITYDGYSHVHNSIDKFITAYSLF
ncbi:hypothetical protein [Serratia sp. NFX21]|uniref:hypothetical protein n=1 Tax=Serratia sp. NFX21 TaxID=3402279 RepID=UPI003AF3CC37